MHCEWTTDVFPGNQTARSTCLNGLGRWLLLGSIKATLGWTPTPTERSPWGGGVEYLHRDPASRRRRRKGKSQIWDSKIPRDSDPKKDCAGKGQQHTCVYKRQTRPLDREGDPRNQERNCQESIPYSERKKNLVVSPRWVLYTKTDWPTDRRS
jgi:hypothetical protein